MSKKTTKQMPVAVISGGTGYIGSAVAQRLAADGFRVAIVYRSLSEAASADFISKLPGAGHKAYRCELSDSDAVSKMFQRVETELGPIRAGIHAAGEMPKIKQLHLSTAADLREQLEANVISGFNFLSGCAAKVKDRGGVIIGITTASVVSSLNTRARGSYQVVKFALQGALSALKEELASHHVRVYSVAPGFLPGGMNRDTPKAFSEILREKSPTKTLAEASDVAATISFLCSDDSKHLANLTLLVAPESGTD